MGNDRLWCQQSRERVTSSRGQSRRPEGGRATQDPPLWLHLPCPPLDFLLWEKPLPSAPSPAAEFLMRAVTFNTHRYTRIPGKSIHPKTAGVLNSNGNRSQADQMWVNLTRCIQVGKDELERAGHVEASTVISSGQGLLGEMPARDSHRPELLVSKGSPKSGFPQKVS